MKWITDADRDRWLAMSDAERAELTEYAEYLVDAGYDAPQCLSDVISARLAGA